MINENRFIENKEETQTFCEWICIKSHKDYSNERGFYVEGAAYYFHEDDPPLFEYFLPVIDSEGFPVTKTCRVDR